MTFNRPIKPERKAKPGANASRNKAALSKMTLCEVWTGKTPAQLDAEHAVQRERVLRRYGIRP